MRRPEFIARQASCPTGLLGRLLARIMAVETSAANAETLELLAIQPHDHLLEIGFGHGRTLARAAATASAGFVAGIDVSEEMVDTATCWNQSLIREGRVEVQCASSLQIPYPSQSFDRVYTAHTLYFWESPQRHLQEIYRVMKPGARFILTCSLREDEQAVAKFPATIYRFYTKDEVRGLLAQAGFVDLHVECQRMGSKELAFAIAHRKTSSSTPC